MGPRPVQFLDDYLSGFSWPRPATEFLAGELTKGGLYILLSSYCGRE